MIRRVCVAVCVLAALSMFGCAGCDRPTPGKACAADAEILQARATLDEAQREKGQLQGDVKKLETSLAEAESKLAETTKANDGLQQQVRDLTTAKDGLQQQVQDLTKVRGNLEAKVDEVSKARASLETRVNDLTKSRDDLQKMVEGLVDTRGVLEKQVASLTKARTAALEDARTAQTRVDTLNDKLKAQTQQMIELQEQIKTIRSVLQQLQQKLE